MEYNSPLCPGPTIFNMLVLVWIPLQRDPREHKLIWEALKNSRRVGK